MKDDLTSEQTDRLEAALQTLDRPDGVARARLLAALPAGGPPAQVSLRQARWRMIRKVGNRAAAAAMLAMAVVGVWQAVRPRSVFARAAAAMVEARGFRCDMVGVNPRDGGREDLLYSGTATWSPTGGNRLETIMRDEVVDVVILPPGRPGISLQPKTKQYRVLPQDRDPEFSATLFARLAEFPGPAGPPVEARVIDGRPAQRYDIAWAVIAPATDHKDAQLRVWLDATTNLPVRADLVDFTTRGGPFVRLENFRWGEQDSARFATAPPIDYKKRATVDARGDQATEHIIYGLQTFAKYNNGRYPAVRYVYGDEQGEALRKLIGVGPKAQGWVGYDQNIKWKDPREGEFAFGSSAMGWINALQRENPDCVYNGKTVTPQDAAKVLLRWQLDDGDYRVIFGDLKTETVTADRLKEIEAK